MRRVRALLVLRLLLVSNAIVLGAVGGICFAFVEHPAGIVAAVGAWAVGAGLLTLLPLTDPYREPRERRTQED